MDFRKGQGARSALAGLSFVLPFSLMFGSALSGCGGAGTIIDERYQIRGSRGEVVRDVVTGLEWQRCSFGQNWNGDTCVGEAVKLNWSAAQTAGDQSQGWRLPAREELFTLVYCSSGMCREPWMQNVPCCSESDSPTIVAAAFPNTPDSVFWSGSLHGGSSHHAWGLNFWNGRLSNMNRINELHYVRFVRDVR